MPSIQTASIPVTSFPNEFVSPWGNDEVIPLYSSVPLRSPVVGCLPCVVCGNSVIRSQAISNVSFNPNGSEFNPDGNAFNQDESAFNQDGNRNPKVVLTLRQPPVGLINWTQTVNNPCDPDPWDITNEGKSIRYNITDSGNCGGPCGSIQSGEATATITVSSKAQLNLDFSGVVEWQDAGFESLQFYLNGNLIAYAGSRDENRACSYFGPPESNYIIPPPYVLEPNINHSLVVSFTTGDALFHLGCYYQVDLSFTWVY